MKNSSEDVSSEIDPSLPVKPGKSINDGKGRVFPCDRCGADLEFSIGQQSLQCPYCGSIKQIELPADMPVVERDFLETLDRLQRLRESQAKSEGPVETQTAIQCDSCGAQVIFQGTLTSTLCPYCAAPLQRDKVHDCVVGIPVDGMLPFLVPKEHAAENLRNWVKSLWWAPNEFLRQGANGRFNGAYFPYFTYDALTFTRYTGQRGDAYYVTVGEGNTQRRERRVRWQFAGGEFQRFFDDVLVIAAGGEPTSLVHDLEPWPLDQLIPYTPAVLAGFFSRTYDVELEDGFREARNRIDAALAMDVRQRIGGDEQRIGSLNSNYSALTYKHLLLPVWLLAYRYKGQTFQVMVNATTGRVTGQRPYSWVKITFAVLFATIVMLVIWGISQNS